jgi:hypothetical protein
MINCFVGDFILALALPSSGGHTQTPCMGRFIIFWSGSAFAARTIRRIYDEGPSKLFAINNG